MTNADAIWTLVEAKREIFFGLSDRVWDTPETNYAEFASADAHEAILATEGFRVARGVGGMPTAVIGEAGAGGPIIAILGEFDALPGLSQEAGIAQKRSLGAGGNGHGCGHNLLGAGAMMAATAVKDYLAAHGLAGRIRYYGCPAEEGGSSKGFMVRRVFSTMSISPSPGTRRPLPASTIRSRWPAMRSTSISPAGPPMLPPRRIWGAVRLMRWN